MLTVTVPLKVVAVARLSVPDAILIVEPAEVERAAIGLVLPLLRVSVPVPAISIVLLVAISAAAATVTV